MFGSGTAVLISPVERIVHRQNNRCEDLYIPTMQNEWQLHARITRKLQDIQRGVIDHPWALEID